MIPLLAGLKILDISSIVLAPFTAQIFADLGADVIKVEPVGGDLARQTHPASPQGDGALFVNNNRNKRSIAIDLKAPGGKKILDGLIRRTDVLLHNMRHEAIERLGYGFSAVKEINPEIIYCSAVGFGRRGRYRDVAAYDDVIQASSGLAALPVRMGNDPAYVPSIIADKVTALYAAYGILAATTAKARGRGQAIEIEVPMFETMVSFILNEHLGAATFDPSGRPGYDRLFSENRRPYRTRDGWIAILPYTTEQWRRCLVEIGRSDIMTTDWFSDPTARSRQINILYSILGEATLEKTTQEWIDVFSALDIPYAKLNDLESLLNDPHLNDVEFFSPKGTEKSSYRRGIQQPVVFHDIPEEINDPSPGIGAHSAAILSELGYSSFEIDALIEGGVVRESR